MVGAWRRALVDAAQCYQLALRATGACCSLLRTVVRRRLQPASSRQHLVPPCSLLASNLLLASTPPRLTSGLAAKLLLSFTARSVPRSPRLRSQGANVGLCARLPCALVLPRPVLVPATACFCGGAASCPGLRLAPSLTDVRSTCSSWLLAVPRAAAERCCSCSLFARGHATTDSTGTQSHASKLRIHALAAAAAVAARPRRQPASVWSGENLSEIGHTTNTQHAQYIQRSAHMVAAAGCAKDGCSSSLQRCGSRWRRSASDAAIAVSAEQRQSDNTKTPSLTKHAQQQCSTCIQRACG